MSGDVTRVGVVLSNSVINHTRAKSSDLGMDFDGYTNFALALVNELPTQMLFVMSAGVPVEFRAFADLGGEPEL